MKYLLLLISLLALVQTSTLHAQTPPKRGITVTGSTFFEDKAQLRPSWIHDYSCAKTQTGGETYVPFLSDEAMSDRCATDQLIPADYDGYIMLYNEPELPFQAGLTVADALDLFAIDHARYPDAKWIAPSMLWPNGEQWHTWFHQQVDNDLIAGIAVHFFWQDEVAAIDEVYQWMVDMGLEDKELWVTEFSSCHNWEGTAELERIFNGYDNDPRVTRYAYYKARDDGSWWAECEKALLDFETGDCLELGFVFNEYCGVPTAIASMNADVRQSQLQGLVVVALALSLGTVLSTYRRRGKSAENTS